MLVIATVTSPGTGDVLLGGSYYSPHDPQLHGLSAEALDDQCSPSPIAAVFFFVAFQLLCAFIIINIVVAIILEGMINDEADELLPVPRQNVAQYVQVRKTAACEHLGF